MGDEEGHPSSSPITDRADGQRSDRISPRPAEVNRR
jgi:hypothetical protein